ncbi:hypothetical protein MUU72_29900 [Streptomyces sp. RS10V-4]|uniref:hypothetical protein n=1 Tax=Streptomyces rhizoryzae TaxID=2932493 RepID=UPI00200426DC|nr:hypothetical protein [Streptomyces rhizoryzae]MCK7627260.1 hypothetical protein [Streptomyces rhizoryzae]
MHDEIADAIWEAVYQWVKGRREESAQILTALTKTQTPSMMYGVACGIATVAKAAVLKVHGHHHRACFWGIGAVDGSRPESTIPPTALFAARFIAANLNGDSDMALALYQAAYTAKDKMLWPACMHALLAATGEAVFLATAGAER